MKTLFKLIIAFFALTGAVALLTQNSDLTFGQENFWDVHSAFFLVAITFFPRLTLLFSGVAWGGLLWWLGLIFAPRVLVAFLATIAYWQQNPVLVAIAWVVAVGGESSEKYVVVSRTPNARKRGFDEAKWVDSD